MHCPYAQWGGEEGNPTARHFLDISSMRLLSSVQYKLGSVVTLQHSGNSVSFLPHVGRRLPRIKAY